MSDLPAFVLVTGNRHKAAEAERILGGPVETLALDLPEIQSLDLLEVIQAKGEEAWRRLARPLVVEDTSLALAALGGFPGPLVRWMLEAVGAEGIARTAIALGDVRVRAHCAVLYRDERGAVLGEAVDDGRLVLPRGELGFGWDPIFQPEGGGSTYGEMPDAEKLARSHRGQAWRALAGALAAQRRR